MGCETLKRQSQQQLERRIRWAAKTTANVFLTVHAKQQMKARKVTAAMVYECLRQGRMLRPSEENIAFGTLECRMERYCAGCNCTVIVALSDDDPSLICVTAWV